MYVSVTGLKPKGLLGWLRFFIMTAPASRKARKADGVLLCDFGSRDGYQNTLTVWESKKHMMAYRASPSHLRAMKRISQIGAGKVHGYEADFIPSWEDAFAEYDRHAREV